MEKTEAGNRQPFRLRSAIFSITILFIILFLMIFVNSSLVTRAYRQLSDSTEELQACTVAIAELESAANLSSEQAALYVRQHDPAYMTAYISIADSRLNPLLEDLRRYSGTPSADSALDAAAQALHVLQSQEANAMRIAAAAVGMDASRLVSAFPGLFHSGADVVFSPEQADTMAIELLHTAEYAQSHSDFRAGLEAFRAILFSDLNQAVQSRQSSALRLMGYQYACLSLLLTLTLFTCIFAIRRLLRPIENCVVCIRQGKPLPVTGVNELKVMARSYNAAYARNNANQEKLRRLAEHDPMTGLLNQGFYSVLKTQLQGSRVKLGLLVIDVDCFKRINDTYGHEAGNQTLKKIATTLQRSVRPDDYVIRYGGDEFAVVLLNAVREDADRLEQMIARINESLWQPVDGLPPVSLSVGASFSENGFHEQLFQQADQAMYEVKRKGRCGFAVYQNTPAPSEISAPLTPEPSKPRILLVDDSELNRELLCSMLENEYDVLQLANGQQAIEEIGKCGYTLTAVLLDLMMPVCDGYEVLAYMQKHRWNELLPVIIISSETDPACIGKAYDLGATDFISRPFDAQLVLRRVNNTVDLNLRYKRLTDLLTRKIQEKLEGYDMMLSVLSQVVEFRNQESGNHVLHIGIITELLLECLMRKSTAYALTYEDIQQIRFASALHDIGKITIPDEIINKPGQLTDKEWAIMETHSAAGADMLDQIGGFAGNPMIRRAWEICRWHHERYDGRGYPDGLVGDAIPISAQVVSMADAYDALTSERCYKHSYPHEQAIAMIQQGECGAFNPLLLECLNEIADSLPEKLHKNALNRTWNHGAMVKEISHLDELDMHSKVMFQLQYEQACVEYFKKLLGGCTFSYRMDTELLILSPDLAKLMNMAEVIHAPAQNASFIAQAGKPEVSWRTLRNSASAESPECTARVTLGEGAQARVYQYHIRTIWSNEETPQLLGMVGILQTP